MDAETPRLRALLDELHGELSRESSAGVDETRRKQLLDLQADIERLLARKEADPENAGTGPTSEEHAHLRTRLQEAMVSFEGAHPRITSTLEQAMNALSNLGL